MQKIDTQALAAANKAAAADLAAMATTAFAGFEKLAELNIATAKSALESSLSSIQAAAAATTPQDVIAVSTKLAQPLAEKAAAKTVEQIRAASTCAAARRFCAVARTRVGRLRRDPRQRGGRKEDEPATTGRAGERSAAPLPARARCT